MNFYFSLTVGTTLRKKHTNSGEEGGIVKLPREDWIVDVLGEEGSFYMDESEMQI